MNTLAHIHSSIHPTTPFIHYSINAHTPIQDFRKYGASLLLYLPCCSTCGGRLSPSRTTTTSRPAPYLDPKKPEDWVIQNNWIIELKENSKMNPWEHAGWATKIHEENPQGLYGVVDVYSDTVFKGYHGWFTDETAEKIRKHPDVSACICSLMSIWLLYCFNLRMYIFQTSNLSCRLNGSKRILGKP